MSARCRQSGFWTRPVGSANPKLSLPKVLNEAVRNLKPLGEVTQTCVLGALMRLWFDAAHHGTDGRVYLLTGDIPAMWIRDSVWQARPLLRFAGDAEIREFLVGLIAAQADFLAIDPYANAFNLEPNGNCWHKDFKNQSPWVFERKFELDSITSFLQLSLDLADTAGVADHLTPAWWSVVAELLAVLEAETNHNPASYRLVRKGRPAHDFLSHDGYGAPFSHCGLIWSAFRPSDDACELPFHIPSNLHAASQLARLADLASDAGRRDLADRCRALSAGIYEAVIAHAVIQTEAGEVLAYEVDGLGGAVLMDDANYPNLISLPFLGLERDDRYELTRARALSLANPWYFAGSVGSGLGSPHTGADMIWPLGIAMAGLTDARPAAQLEALRMIEDSRSANGFIHESFNKNDPQDFTRDWFSWAEMTYVELAFRLGLD